MTNPLINKDGLEFDTPAWQAQRNAKLYEWTQDINAVQFIVQFSDACELFDDLIDKDKPIPDDHVVRVLFVLLTEMPMNPFFDAHKIRLIPVIVTGINAWLDANTLEKGSSNDRVFSYVLRDWYAELIAYVVYLCRGRDYMRSVSMEVRNFFTHHETLEQYREALK
jgi:hypothetical protein